MAYIKPSVQITQIQKTVSPNLITPDLSAVVIGPAYQVFEMGDNRYGTYSNAGTTITLSGLTAWHYLDADSVYVDLYMASGINYGTRYHVPAGSLTVANGGTTVQIAASLGGQYTGSNIYVGYRAMRVDRNAFLTFETLTDIDAAFGSNATSTFNPLGLSLKLALDNGQTTVYGYGTRADGYATGMTASGVATEHAAAMDTITTQEVYAIAPLVTDSAVLSTYQAHVLSMSTPEERKERILVRGTVIPWVTAGGSPTTYDAADKAATARQLRDAASSILEHRVFNVVPDVIIIRETRHISTLTSTYLNAMYGLSTTIYATLATNVTVSTDHPVVAEQGKTYYAGAAVNPTLYAVLTEDPDTFEYDVYVPLPGSFLTAAVAGQISGNYPEQPLTNINIAGISAVKFASDWFTESQLNTIAEGGNYIIFQGNAASAPTCRHQLSTNMSSVQTRELSITKTLDYIAKFIRNSISSYIGRNTISPAFLSLLFSSIKGLGDSATRDGRINGFKLLSVAQDTIQLDTVRASIEVAPKYPVNYIKIDLIF